MCIPLYSCSAKILFILPWNKETENLKQVWRAQEKVKEEWPPKRGTGQLCLNKMHGKTSMLLVSVWKWAFLFELNCDINGWYYCTWLEIKALYQLINFRCILFQWKGKGDVLSLLIIHGYAGISSCFQNYIWFELEKYYNSQ